MKELLLAISIICATLIGRAEAQEPEIQSVISDQVAAFQVDDFAAAFAYASPNIQSIFETPERFGAMVENGYPMVHRAEEFRFLDLREIAGALWQKVLFRDQSGGVHILDYQMVQGAGGWKINAVQLLRAPDVGA